MKTIIFGSIISFVLFWGNRVAAQVVDSVAVVREVDSLIQMNQDLIKQQKYADAILIIESAKNKAEAGLGIMNAVYASCINNLGWTNYLQGNYFKSEEFYLEAKNIRAIVLGREHLDYARTLHNMAILYRNMGRYEKAETHYLEARSIMEKASGKESPDYARLLNNMARMYLEMGNYHEAEHLYLEAKNLSEKVQGKEHFNYAASLNGLAYSYMIMGNYEKAEPLNIEANNIWIKVLGKENPTYALSLNNLANLYHKMGNYKKAEPLYLESKTIREKILGSRHPVYLESLNNLAALYHQIGNYEKAELLYLESKGIREKVLGKEHPDYAMTLKNLASFYNDISVYEKAEILYLESKAIQEKVLGKEHPDYAMTLGSLANFYHNVGDYNKSELLYLESKAIREKVFGKEHPDYAFTLNNLAGLYHDMGNYENAELLYLESKSIVEKILGKKHPHYATTLNNLAVLYGGIGNYEKAELLYLESQSIREKALGKEHPDYALLLYAMAVFYTDMSKYQQAESKYIESAQITWRNIEQATTYLSERELQNYIKRYNRKQDNILSFASKHKSVESVGMCYNNAIIFKGFLLHAVNQLRNLSFSDSTTTHQFNLLQSYGRRLAKEYEKPIAERDSARVASLEANSENLEKELTRTVARFADARRQVQWQEVQQTLQPSEAAVEFVHYQFSNPKPTDSILYAALVLLPADASAKAGYDATLFIPLFEQKQLSTLLSKTQNSAQSVGSLYAAARSGIVLDEIPAYGTELYNLIWKPLDSLLQGITTVYFSPSGLLHRVNLAAIPVDSTHVLADKYTLRQMSSTRSLVVKTPEPVPTGYTAALFGGIRYNSDSTTLSSAALASRGSETPASRSTLEYTADVQRDTTKTWNYLEGTRSEVDSLQRQMKRNGMNVKTFTGLAATEESLKILGRPLQGDKSPDILHIATHGFFFDDPEKRQEQRFGDENVFRWNENPLFRSGLIMAGADHAWQTGRPYANLEDGICTAYEISHLNLTNTKLAVLSACETGLGDIKGSEGVYGLQRAFKMAGVDYLIVSLWKVPDEQTVEFMDAFYRNWLGGKTIHRAFSEAQQMMRKNNSVYEWGAWVLIE